MTTLLWKPTDPTKPNPIINVSELEHIFCNAFGDSKLTLTDVDISVLKGIYACGHEDILELIHAINKHGSVDIWFNVQVT